MDIFTSTLSNVDKALVELSEIEFMIQAKIKLSPWGQERLRKLVMFLIKQPTEVLAEAQVRLHKEKAL